MTRNRYGIRNRYVPTALAPRAYGWKNGNRNRPGDVPARLLTKPTGMSSEVFRQQFAYEWLNSSRIGSGLTNPPFVSGAAGRLLPLMNVSGEPARITRGYIRRAETDAGDEKSKARMYFMFNPEVIQREYVSYLDQTALDPFNTVYQSGNLVAPPSIMDFTFSLFFDRQEEAHDPAHPGVFVDYQYFDLVVRNVVPDDPGATSNTLPDSGVMMVNPREITVVFSPQLTVQGRPLNARVTFEKFTHKMTPVRMRIDLTMRATYFGPQRPQGNYTAETFAAEDSIPYSISGEFEDVGITFETLTIEGTSQASGILAPTAGGNDLRTKAMQWADAHVIEGETKYSQPLRQAQFGIDGNFTYVDCSSLVQRAYDAVGATHLGWDNNTTTNIMVDGMLSGSLPCTYWKRADILANTDILAPGDLLLRRGHVGFFWGWAGPPTATILDAASASSNPQVGKRNMPISSNGFDYAVRISPPGGAPPGAS